MIVMTNYISTATTTASTVCITGALHKPLTEEFKIVLGLLSINFEGREIVANTAT